MRRLHRPMVGHRTTWKLHSDAQLWPASGRLVPGRLAKAPHRIGALGALALLLAGCGTEPAVRFVSSALAAETDRLALYYFEAEARCVALTTSSDRSAALHGPFASEPLDDDERREGFRFEALELPTGTYVVVVDALNVAGTRIGAGCAEAQQILERRASFTDIVIHAVQ